MNIGDTVKVRTFDEKVWDVVVLKINTTSARVKILSPDWKGTREITRKLGRDFVAFEEEVSNDAP